VYESVVEDIVVVRNPYWMILSVDENAVDLNVVVESINGSICHWMKVRVK